MKLLVEKDINFVSFLGWLGEMTEELDAEKLVAKGEDMKWNVVWLNKQLFGILAAVATGS